VYTNILYEAHMAVLFTVFFREEALGSTVKHFFKEWKLMFYSPAYSRKIPTSLPMLEYEITGIPLNTNHSYVSIGLPHSQ
jgi:hypothetical protein